MRTPWELGLRPERSRSTPAFISSSLYLPMAESSSSLGIFPASLSLFALTIIMNRILLSQLDLETPPIVAQESASTYTSNQGSGNRPTQYIFLASQMLVAALLWLCPKPPRHCRCYSA